MQDQKDCWLQEMQNTACKFQAGHSQHHLQQTCFLQNIFSTIYQLLLPRLVFHFIITLHQIKGLMDRQKDAALAILSLKQTHHTIYKDHALDPVY